MEKNVTLKKYSFWKENRISFVIIVLCLIASIYCFIDGSYGVAVLNAVAVVMNTTCVYKNLPPKWVVQKMKEDLEIIEKIKQTHKNDMECFTINSFPTISLIFSVAGWVFLLLLFAQTIERQMGMVACLISFAIGFVFLFLWWIRQDY